MLFAEQSGLGGSEQFQMEKIFLNYFFKATNKFSL